MEQRMSDRAQENEALAARYSQTKDPALRDEVVERYLYLAQLVARRFQNRGLEYEDLYQVACMGVVRALERYDSSKGVKFSSYLVPTLVGEIKNHFRDQSRTVRLPRGASEALARMSAVQTKLEQQLGRSPRPEELAQEMGLTTEQVLGLLESQRVTSVASLEARMGEDNEAELYDWLGRDEEGYTWVENQQTVSRLLSTLADREQELVRLRFYDQLSQRQAAQRLGVSQMYVSRMERRILERLRRTAKESGAGEV